MAGQTLVHRLEPPCTCVAKKIAAPPVGRVGSSTMRVGGTTSRSTAAVEQALGTLPERYLGAPRAFDVTYHFVLADLGRTWEVRLRESGARVRRGVSRAPDVVVGL